MMNAQLVLQVLGLGTALISSTSAAPAGELQTAASNPAAANNSTAISTSTSRSTPLPPGAYVSPWLLDIIKLSQAHIDQSVLLMFVDSAGTFNLDADQIIYLRDIGISADVITAMLQHDAEIFSGLRPLPVSPSATRPGMQMTFSPITQHAESSKPVEANTNSIASIPSSSAPQVPIAAPAPVAEATLNTEASEPTVANDEEFSAAPPIESVHPRVVSEPPALFPVRKPYPVPLTDPIILVRGEGPIPNIVRIELFP